MQAVHTWTTRLWKFAAFATIGLMVVSVLIVMDEDMPTIIRNIFLFYLGVGVLLACSSVIALLFGLIPFKQIPYSEKVFFLAPGLFMLLEIVAIILFAFFRSYI